GLAASAGCVPRKRMPESASATRAMRDFIGLGSHDLSMNDIYDACADGPVPTPSRPTPCVVRTSPAPSLPGAVGRDAPGVVALHRSGARERLPDGVLHGES